MTADHLAQISQLAARAASTSRWVAVCGSCDWADAAGTREDAARAGDRHRELVGQVPARVGEE